MAHSVDAVLGIQYGDEGKGKIIYSLCKNHDYDFVMRFNGGGNAGHTIYHNGKKFITHIIPSGIFFGMETIIGPGCVINAKKLKEEAKMLEDNGIEVYKHLHIAKNAHIVQQKHIEEEIAESRIGTTRQGIGPAYRDKYGRVGMRAEKCSDLSEFNLVDMYSLFHESVASYHILCEGAQSFFLDVDWGDYPYVTSSHCGIGSIILNGIDFKWINNVYGIAKVYETYVGSKQFEDKDNKTLQLIRTAGEEYGATTGRPRQVNWLNISRLIKAIRMNSVNVLVFNKFDILKKLGEFKCFFNGESSPVDYREAEIFEKELKHIIRSETGIRKICFSESKDDVEVY